MPKKSLLPLLLSLFISFAILLHHYIHIIAIAYAVISLCIPYKATKKIAIILLLSLCFGQYIHTEWNKRYQFITQYPSQTTQTFTGTLTYVSNDYAKLKTDNGYQLSISLKKVNKPISIHVGDTVSLTGKFIAPQLPRNPGQFNAMRYAIIKKKLGHCRVISISCIKKGHPYHTLKLSTKIKQHIIKQYEKCMPSPQKDVYAALIFGESYTQLPHSLKLIFKKAGLLHALVVSGSQVSLVLTLLTLVLNTCGIYRYFQWIILIPTCCMFYLVTGPGAAILRSMLMAGVMIFLRDSLRYQTSPIYILNVTWIFMLIIDPFICFDLGALLSFAATFSLLYGVPFITKKLSYKIHPKCAGFLALGLAPWIMTTPLLLLTQHQLPITSIVCNLLLMNAIEFLVILGFIATCLGFLVFPIALLCHQVSYVIINVIIYVATNMSTLDIAIINIQFPLLLLSLVASSWIYYKLLNPKKIYIGVYIATSCLLYNGFIYNHAQTLRITQLDVGQGDCTLVRYKNITILIDTGPSYDPYHNNIAQNILFPALQHYGINTIDYLIISHFDQDHSGNLQSLITNYPIKNIIHNNNLTNYLNKNHITLNSNTKTHHFCNNQSLRFGDTAITFYQPCSSSHLNKNNQSLVFKITKNKLSMLFTGDIEEKVETLLTKTYGSHLDSTILKVPHHGSQTSSTIPFLKSVNPDHSIVPAGILNRFGHPNPKVINRLKDLSTVWETHRLGAIIITIKHNLKIKTFNLKRPF